MATNSSSSPTWVEKRRQRRKKIVFTRTVITIVILASLAVLLAAIGFFFTIQGGVVLTVVGIIATLVAWLFPPPFQNPSSQKIALEQSTSLQVNPMQPLQILKDNKPIFHYATKLSDHRNVYGRETECYT